MRGGPGERRQVSPGQATSGPGDIADHVDRDLIACEQVSQFLLGAPLQVFGYPRHRQATGDAGAQRVTGRHIVGQARVGAASDDEPGTAGRSAGKQRGDAGPSPGLGLAPASSSSSPSTTTTSRRPRSSARVAALPASSAIRRPAPQPPSGVRPPAGSRALSCSIMASRNASLSAWPDRRPVMKNDMMSTPAGGWVTNHDARALLPAHGPACHQV